MTVPESSTHATEELYHTHLLRLQANELLSESVLNLCNHTGELENEVRWADDVRIYLETVKDVIANMKACTLTPDLAIIGSGSSENKGKQEEEIKAENKKTSSWIHLQSDKALKHLEGKQKWEFPFGGGHSLKIAPIHAYAAGGVGLTTTSANGNVIPSIDFGIFIPTSTNDNDSAASAGNDNNSTIGGKDYLNYRYFDKRNILALHIAKYLSQKKQRQKVGAVHIRHNLDGCDRKISIILTPPLDDVNETLKEPQKKKQKKKHKSEDESASTLKQTSRKSKKLRFRVRIIIGTCNRNKNGMHSWVPTARLFPDRSNNKMNNEAENNNAVSRGTTTYNSSLAIDHQYLEITNILNDTFHDAGKSFIESVALFKIWCLQRGFLRGHDTFSESSIGLFFCYLFRTKLISIRMDCIQIFTIAMKFLAEQNWLGSIVDDTNDDNDDPVGKDTIRFSHSQGYNELKYTDRNLRQKIGIVMPDNYMSEKDTIMNSRQHVSFTLNSNDKNSKDGKEGGKSLMQCFKNHTEGPVFLDPTMSVNYFYNLSPSFIEELQTEAKLALSKINCHSFTSNTRTFQDLFLEQTRFWRRYDAFVKVDLEDIDFNKNEDKQSNALCWTKDANDLGNSEALMRGLTRILRLALGNRVTALRLFTSGNGQTDNHAQSKTILNSLDDIGITPLLDSDDNLAIPMRTKAGSKNDFTIDMSDNLYSPSRRDLKKHSKVVIGFRINSNTCHQIVDRGPPADDSEATASFLSLWGKKKAQLRRFKDGAIVHAVLWNESITNYKTYSGDTRLGGVVEQIVQHIIGLHFTKKTSSPVLFTFRDIVSLIDSLKSPSGSADINDPITLQKSILGSFDSLSNFLKDNSLSTPTGSKLGLPLSIDAVEALSPCLRYAELFPPQPHALLGHSHAEYKKKMSGVLIGDPIQIQIRFESSSKWPTDINAMGAAKCAMLMTLAEGIKSMKERHETHNFDGYLEVTPSYVDLGYMGFIWRIFIRPDQELKMLQSLRKPSSDAIALHKILRKRHIISALHHYTMLSVHTKYPASSYVLRLAKRWVAAHMLSDLIPNEAIELLIAYTFVDSAYVFAPSTVFSGFMRFLHLLAYHDWINHPLIVDPHNQITSEEKALIYSRFKSVRGESYDKGPPMYIVSPDDFNEEKDNLTKTILDSSFTHDHPEKVVLNRICSIAKRAHNFLIKNLARNDDDSSEDCQYSWVEIFQESMSSLKAYSALIRVNSEIIIDRFCSSTMIDFDYFGPESLYTLSMKKRAMGPKTLYKKVYKNLDSKTKLVCAWQPVESVLASLRARFGHLMIFFYNDLTPDVIAMLWRPQNYDSVTFSTFHSEYKVPIDEEDGIGIKVVTNASDIFREIGSILSGVAIDLKIFDKKLLKSE